MLTASAKPGAYSSFQQGTGRTDLVRALDQSVVTDQGPLDFGKQLWPHDDNKPVVTKLTYSNLGTEPVTLGLSAGALTVDGKPAAECMFSVSPGRITVSVGGGASAEVTADTRVGTTDGSFGGAVSATSADDRVQVRTAVGVECEVESYDLTLKHIDESGSPTGDAATSVLGFDRDFFGTFTTNRTASSRCGCPRATTRLRA
ncbi:hypothetical protein [Streptomyces sp. NPDC098781]|uniref:hypothetical protein n=1 Tax=Streptomyces sp. NPDC098781 TaxID=3366097 RepID=UPI00382AB934